MARLEYILTDDFKTIIEWNEKKSAEFLLQWAGPLYKHPLTEEQILIHYNSGVNIEGANRYIYKIIDADTKKMIGTIELALDFANDSGRVCRFLIGDEAARGKGIGTEVLGNILGIGFKELGLHKICLGVFEFNKSAVGCYEKVGFKIDGLFRDYRKIGSEYWGLYEMSILEDEWKSKLS